MSQQEQGEITGTRDRHYDLLWFTQACLDNVLRLQTYAQDAERDGDQELADFFRKAQGDSQKGADQGKELLRSRLAK
jgi:predicted metal-dependent HD superfamily phosphohydrolase